MTSTFHGIELGKRALITHQGALSVTGHNLTNASNPEYSRQKVQIQTYHPIHPPGLNRTETAGQIGSGSVIERVQRVRDEFVDNRIINEQGNHSFWSEKSFYLTQLEHIHNEPNTPNLQTRFEQFVNDWNALANNPIEGGARESLRSSAEGLTTHMHTLHKHLTQLRDQANQSIHAKVIELNTYIKQIADLNNEITKIEATGDHPNDLLDTRDGLIEKLSKLANISVSRSDQDEFLVYLNSERLVQGSKYEELRITPNRLNEGLFDIQWGSGQSLRMYAGALGGLLSARDTDIKTEIDKLNTLALNLMDTVNEIHRDGMGLNLNTQIDFFHYKTLNSSKNGEVDRNADGILDSTSLYKVHGSVSLQLDDIIGSSGTLTFSSEHAKQNTISYTSTDSVRDVLNKINAAHTNITAYLNHKGQLTIKALHDSQKPYAIQTLQDTGIFFTHYTGLFHESDQQATFHSSSTHTAHALRQDYTISPHPHPASWISISDSIRHDINNIAAARGHDTTGDGRINHSSGENDGSNALRIVAALTSEHEKNTLSQASDIDHSPVMLDHNAKSFRAYINKNIEALGANSRKSQLEFKKEAAIIEHLVNTKHSISGVNIDEELTAMVSYQHGYNASARFLSHVDKMLETLINKMGI